MTKKTNCFSSMKCLQSGLHARIGDADGGKVPLELRTDGANLRNDTEDVRFLHDLQNPVPSGMPPIPVGFMHGFIAGKKLSIFLEIIPEEDGKFHIIIKNDGNPIPNDELVHLNADDDDVLKKKKSLGFANTRKRLLLFFKGNAAMTVDSDGINGSEVRILLPIKG